MKKFTISCQFGEITSPFNIYIGEPALEPADTHPLEQQAAWLQRERGGTVPAVVMDNFYKLLEIAKDNKVSYEELCVYALGTAGQPASGNAEPSVPDAADVPTGDSPAAE